MPKKTYKPGVYYDVRLTRAVQMGPFKYLPRNTLRMLGSTLKSIVDQGDGDAIGSAKPVE